MNLPVKKSVFLVSLFLSVPTTCVANDNTLWLGYTQTSTDYFDDGNSTIKPGGFTLGYSRTFSDEWILSFSYGELDDGQRWSLQNPDLPNAFNQAEIDTKMAGVNLSRQFENYALSLSYGEVENRERALSRLPLIAEEIQGEDKFASLSIDDYFDFNDVFLGWAFGVQYSDNKNLTRQVFFTDPVTITGAQFDQETWSSYIDLDISRWYEYESFSWAPQFSLSWNWEISSSGDPLFVVTRGDERRVFNQFNDRLMGSFRVPDSGFWELSANFDFLNDWSSSIAYGQSISTDSDIDSISIDISLAF